MKRKWRIGRVVLGLMIVGTAVVVYGLWRIPPQVSIPIPLDSLWNCPAEYAVAIDDQQGLLWTRPHQYRPQREPPLPPDRVILLHGYDLETGRRVESKHLGYEFNFREPFGAAHCKTLFSPKFDRIAVLCETNEPRLVVFSMASGEAEWSMAQRIDRPDAISFSRSGRYLAARFCERVVVWQSGTGHVAQTLTMPAGSVEGTRRGYYPTYRWGLDFTSDDRYLAVVSDHTRENQGQEFVVFDLRTGKVAGRCPRATAGCFPDGKPALATFPSINDGGDSIVRYYDCQEGHLQPRPEQAAQAWRLRELGNKLAYEAHASLNELERLLRWLPDSWYERSKSAFLGHEWLVRILVRDVLSGSVEDLLVVRGNESFDLIVSPTGKFLAVQDRTGIRIWGLPTRRPLSCWLTCGGLVLLAAWVGWPRKGKAAAVAG